MARHLLLAAILGALALPAGCSCAPAVRFDRFGDPLPAGAVARLGTVRLRDGAGTWAVALSPDGKTLATGTMPGYDRGAVRLWDVATGLETRALIADVNNILSLAWSPDGKELAVAYDYRLEIWNVEKGTLVRQLVTGDGKQGYWCLRWSADGKCLAGYQGGGSQVSIWELPAGSVTLREAPGKIECLDLSRDGQRIAMGGKEFVVVEEAATGRRLFEREKADYHAYAIALSPNGTSLAAVSFLGADHAAKAKGGELWHWPSLTDPGHRVARLDAPTFGELFFAAGGKVLVLNYWYKWIWRWNLAEERELPRIDAPGAVGRMCSVDAAGELVASSDASAGVWRVADGQEVTKSEAHRAAIRRIRFTADGQTILTASNDQTLRAWNADDGSPLARAELPAAGSFLEPVGKDVFFVGGPNFLERVAWPGLERTPIVAADALGAGDWTPQALSPDQSLAAIKVQSPAGDQIRLFDLVKNAWKTGLADPWGVPDFPFTPSAFSHDNQSLIASVGNGNLRVRDLATGEARFEFAQSHWSGYVVSPRDPLVVVARDQTPQRAGPSWLPNSNPSVNGPPRAIHLDAVDYAAHKTLWSTSEPLRASVYRLRLSPDGRLLAVGEGDPTCRVLVFAMSSGRLLATFTGHKSQIFDLEFSPDGRRLVTSSLDTTALVWDISGL